MAGERVEVFQRNATLRLLAKLLAVALVVAVPWLLNQRLIGDALIAQEWVTHTAEVQNLVNALQGGLRDADYALVWLALDPSGASKRSDLAAARKATDERIDELTRRVVDSEDQRERLAQVRALVEARRAEVDRILGYLSAGDVAMARELLTTATMSAQLREATSAIIATESRLLEERRVTATRRHTRLVWLTTGAAAAQLILLVLIVASTERAHRRRGLLEAQTAEARQRSDLILNNVRKPIALLDRDLNIVLCNPAFQAFYAGQGVDLRNQPLGEIGEGVWQDAALLQKLHDVCVFGRELWDYEVEQATASGRRVLLVNARRMPGTSADNATVILTANDVTANRGAEREILDLNERLGAKLAELSEANRELEGFSYSVSHDLRAPLRHIAAFADKLGREIEVAPDSKAAHYLGIIGDSARRMGLLIDELLVHSRLGRGQFRVAPVAMAPLLEEVRSVLAVESAGREVEWRIGELPVVMGDASMLRLVWQNLVGNALKYTGKRDRALIEIDAGHDPERREYVFRVADNGAGFDMAYSDKLFGVFQRLHTADEFPGTGIGLANVRRIIARHGGRVWAEGEPDRGATFHFTLPDGTRAPRQEQ
jgi:signal transduction histidine kinase